MTDREMIEFAAKAIGWRVVSYSEQGTSVVKGGTAVAVAEGKTFGWRPRTDDGDALRLAVKLGFYVEVNQAIGSFGEVPCVVIRGYIYHRHLLTEAAESNEDLPDATRRAIVRAAAQIGKAIA